MSIHTPIEKSGMYFITFTCYKWLPLIELTDAYGEVYNFFNIPQDFLALLEELEEEQHKNEHDESAG